MNEIRTQIQTALSTINDIEVGIAIPDNLVEEGITYFSYELEERHLNNDFQKSNVVQVIITGRLIRREANENTTLILDNALEEIKGVLKSLNFIYSYRDVSAFSDGFKKISLEGSVKYYETNKELI